MVTHPHAFKAVPVPDGFSFPYADRGSPALQPHDGPPGFEPGAAPRQLHDPERRTESPSPSGFPPIRFPAGARTPTGSSSIERRAERTMPMPIGHTTVSNRVRRACPVHSPWRGWHGLSPLHTAGAYCVPVCSPQWATRGSNPHVRRTHGPEPCASTISASRP